MTTRHAVVVMGTAGAGKSRIGTALAARLRVAFVEGDDFHSAENIALMAAGTPLTDENRRGWLQALAEQLRAARDRDSGIVLTCSALKRRYRDVLRAGDDTVRFVMLSAPAELLRERMNARAGHYMPASLIESQLAALEPLTDDEHAWVFDAHETPEAIVDAIMTLISAAATR